MRKTVCGKTGLGVKLGSFLVAAVVASSVEAVTVSSVTELQTAIANATTGAEIVIAASGSPYDLSTADCMSRAGHLYVTAKITLRGETGNPDDVILKGSTNRILYLNVAGCTIRGLTFKAGNCTGNTAESKIEPYDTNQGGAICFRKDRDVADIMDCVFTENTANRGGAVASYYTASVSTERRGGNFSNCIFRANTSAQGGAAYNVGLMRKCTFVGNYHTTASYAGQAVCQAHWLDDCDFDDNGKANLPYGAVYNLGTVAATNQTISNCRFRRNVSSRCGAALGASEQASGMSRTIVYGCLFESNSVPETSGCNGGAIYQMENVSNCTFIGNSAYTGGAAHSSICSNCTFVGNFAYTGGAAYSSICSDCRFSGNHANAYGGGASESNVYGCLFESNSVPETSGCFGGAIYQMENVSNCTFVGNSAYIGGAAYSSICRDCSFSGNTATRGGAAYESKAYGCTFTDNAAKYGAAGHNSTFISCSIIRGAASSGGCAGYTCSFDGCRIMHVGGGLFGDSIYLTNSLIVSCEGNANYLGYNITGGAIVNCTIVSNQFQYFTSGGSNVSNSLHVLNTLFFENKDKDGNLYDIGDRAMNCLASISNSVFSTRGRDSVPGDAYEAGAGNHVYEIGSFNPWFVGSSDPENPYALKRKSPCVTTYHGQVQPWMSSATDIRGAGFPRLREGVVDIGCYQCWIMPSGLVMSFR